MSAVRSVVVALALGVVLGGCQYSDIREAQLAHRAGRPEVARGELASIAADGFAGRHAVLGWLELGAADQAVGNFEASSRALLRAEGEIDGQDARARVSVSEEAFAAVTSPLSVAYRGLATDRVMSPTLRAMNAMLVGDDAGARAALNEAAIRQEMVLAMRRAEIEEARAVAARERSAGRADIDRSVQRLETDPAYEARFGSLRAYEPYRGYVNPFSEMLHAVYRLGAPRDAADRERGLALLRSVAGTVENPYVAELLGELQAGLVRGAIEGGGGDVGGRPGVHVFFATGFCPIREEFRLDLPLFLFNDRVDYVGVSFPTLAFDGDAVGWLDVETDEGIFRSAVLADMDRMMAAEFREQLPVLLTRAIAGTVAKVAASYGINEATRGSGGGSGDEDIANVLARIAAGLYLASQNRADTRAWASLPKAYHYVRVDAPAGGRVLLSTPDGQSVFVDVGSESDSIVFVRSMGRGVGLSVRSVGFASGF